MNTMFNMIRKYVVLVPLLFLLHVPVEVRPAKQKRFGIELCKRHCARYNRCYGIRYNITSTTCTILNDRHTDGDDMHLSRKEILQRLEAQDDCSSSQFYSRLCIVNNKGRAVHIAETTTSLEEEIQSVALNMSSLQHLVCAKGEPTGTTCYIPEGPYSKTDVFGGVIEKEFLPGRRYLNLILFFVDPANVVHCGKIITLSVTDASNLHLKRMTWNITYLFTDNRNVAVHYYGQRGVTKTTLPRLIGYLVFLFDRASSGNFLHAMNVTGNIQGSIELPNLNEAMFIAVHAYLPINVSFNSPMAQQYKTFEKALKNWYTVQYNGTFNHEH